LSGFLLDTHVFLWYASDDPKLPLSIRDRIQLESGQVCLSIVSAWEIAIKVGLGKLDLQIPLIELVGPSLSSRGIDLLPITEEDVVGYASLGFPNLSHRDPFDRALAVQAKRRNLTLVSGDPVFGDYGLDFLPCVG
jgi:PIN domain nuclease of toxin-antitoxin system